MIEATLPVRRKCSIAALLRCERAVTALRAAAARRPAKRVPRRRPFASRRCIDRSSRPASESPSQERSRRARRPASSSTPAAVRPPFGLRRVVRAYRPSPTRRRPSAAVPADAPQGARRRPGRRTAPLPARLLSARCSSVGSSVGTRSGATQRLPPLSWQERPRFGMISSSRSCRQLLSRLSPQIISLKYPIPKPLWPQIINLGQLEVLSR